MAHATNRNLAAKHRKNILQRMELGLQEYTKEIYLRPKPIVPMYLPVPEGVVKVIPAGKSMKSILRMHF